MNRIKQNKIIDQIIRSERITYLLFGTVEQLRPSAKNRVYIIKSSNN